MNVFKVIEAAHKAGKYVREGKGPYILEVQTYRYKGHSMSDPAKYRTKKELESLSRELENVTSGEIMNETFIMGIELGRIKGKELKEFWRKSIVRCHLNHFNSSEERWKVCMSLMASVLTEEEFENSLWSKKLH